ncbi:auxin-induced protein [Cryptococcus bacillisporus CA1873]|uniref:Auxin-induced protein n=1 Tax=Cryptococcus bacillisporus CA1873 TaxID=1296111 RepID=A0ABR5BDF5_CRYGA|nr:auxin-induced protein [Cryptococcus bacillisporus CA1873]|eukprot:KIR67201.1 auxin-induced protein [Cryptococcus gattii CA1873]
MTTAATSLLSKHVTIAGVQVPPMAIGTWSWGDKTWGYEPKDFENVKEAWCASMRAGLTFFDTAEAYGNGESERIIGRLIQEETSEEDKARLYIATKFLPFPSRNGFFFFNPPVVEHLKASLERLGLDSVPLYQLHSSISLNSHEKIASGLAQCVKLGLAKAIGVSNFSKDELIKMSDLLEKHRVKIASNQIELSLLRQLPEQNGLLEEMKKRHITCLAYSPLAMGRLTGKYNASNPIPSGRRFSSQYSWEQLEPLISELGSLANKYEVTHSAVALNWVMSKGAIPLGGARNKSQAEQNAKAVTFKLTDEEVQRLSSLGFSGKNTWFWQRG